MTSRSTMRLVMLASTLSLVACGIGQVTSGPAPAPRAAVGPRSEPVLSADPRARADRTVIVDLVESHQRWRGRAFAERMADVIYAEAREHDLDPLLVAAVTAHESSFRPFAVSHKGARGLMQIRPFVGEDVASRLQLDWDGPDVLHRPEVNVRLGVRYLVELLERFDGDVTLALAAYHRGPTRLAVQLAQGRTIRSRYANRILDLQAALTERSRGRDRTTTLPAGTAGDVTLAALRDEEPAASGDDAGGES
jgi:soluble lytic murein transglycosylase-like protein